MVRAACMPRAGKLKTFKVRVIDLKQPATKLRGQHCSPQAVFWIMSFVHAPRIMKRGKQRDNRTVDFHFIREPTTVLEDSRPMNNPMQPLRIECIILQHDSNEPFKKV